jgi:hypothetical protein
MDTRFISTPAATRIRVTRSASHFLATGFAQCKRDTKPCWVTEWAYNSLIRERPFRIGCYSGHSGGTKTLLTVILRKLRDRGHCSRCAATSSKDL